MLKRKTLLWGALALLVVGTAIGIFFALRPPLGSLRVCDSVAVKDGDTFSLTSRSIRLNVRAIRLLGVDTPEKKDDPKLSEEATAYLRNTLGDKETTLCIQVPEPHNESLTFERVLALVYLDRQQEKSLNEMILKAGWGKIYKFPKPLRNDESLRTRLFKAQIDAALAGKGIWKDKENVFIGGILYWGEQEKVALVNRRETEVFLNDLILRDKNSAKNLLEDDSWHKTATAIPPRGIVYVFKDGSQVWNDDGDVGFLYDAHENELDSYSYKGPG